MNKFFVSVFVLFVITLGLLFYEGSLFSSPNELVTFSSGESYSQDYIDEFFAMSEEESQQVEDDWLNGQIGESGDSVILATSCFDSFQGPSPQGPQVPPPQKTDPLPTKPVPGMPGDSCFWYALLLAKQETFGDQFQYGDLELVLASAKLLGVYQNPSIGNYGTPFPITPAPKDFMNDLNDRIAYVDNLALAYGSGGGNGGDSTDGIVVITPGSLGKENNKALLKKKSDDGNVIVLNFGCNLNGKPTEQGHSVYVPKNGVTPDPSCKSIKFKVKNPDGEVEVNEDGLVISSDKPNVPTDCGNGQTYLRSIVLAQRSSPGTLMPTPPGGFLRAP